LSEIEIKKGRLRDWGESILIALILALFIRTFVVQAFKIPSGSMKPTLLIGDHLLVCKFYYGTKIPFINKFIVRFNSPKHGDIIVFIYPLENKDFIKRIIGLPGDEIEIINKTVYVNGKPYSDSRVFHSDSYIQPKIKGPRDNFGPVILPPNKYFVMGDNRDESYDSRFWGFVDQDSIKGKAFIIYWSWERPFFHIKWSRIGKIIH